MSKWIEGAIRELVPRLKSPFDKWIEGKNGDTPMPKIFSRIAKALYEENKEEIELALLPDYPNPPSEPSLKVWKVFTSRALEVFINMAATSPVPDFSDRNFLAHAVKKARVWGNGAFYLLFNPCFSEGDLKWSEGHSEERVPKAARERIAEIFAKTPPECLDLFPEREDLEVWKVGDTFIQFSAIDTSMGFEQAYIEEVTLVEPYEQMVTLYREVGK